MILYDFVGSGVVVWQSDGLYPWLHVALGGGRRKHHLTRTLSDSAADGSENNQGKTHVTMETHNIQTESQDI